MLKESKRQQVLAAKEARERAQLIAERDRQQAEHEERKRLETEERQKLAEEKRMRAEKEKKEREEKQENLAKVVFESMHEVNRRRDLFLKQQEEYHEKKERVAAEVKARLEERRRLKDKAGEVMQDVMGRLTSQHDADPGTLQVGVVSLSQLVSRPSPPVNVQNFIFACQKVFSTSAPSSEGGFLYSLADKCNINYPLVLQVIINGELYENAFTIHGSLKFDNGLYLSCNLEEMEDTPLQSPQVSPMDILFWFENQEFLAACRQLPSVQKHALPHPNQQDNCTQFLLTLMEKYIENIKAKCPGLFEKYQIMQKATQSDKFGFPMYKVVLPVSGTEPQGITLLTSAHVVDWVVRGKLAE